MWATKKKQKQKQKQPTNHDETNARANVDQ
jgi:hypothetical protein